MFAAGLFLPDLLGGDASQDAVMAMRMHLERDWVHLVKNGTPYLDKPHLLFWSAMAGYALFGVHDWSYRLVSVLVTVLGAWSTFRLGTRLHGRSAGRIAAVMFVTAQATVLGNHDVRMDALLTGFTAFALWHLVAWVDEGRLRSMLLGAVGLGLAFASKGQVAAAAAGSCLLFFVWGRGAWRRLASWHLLAGLVAFAAAIAPVLYAYHAQFGAAGLRFILLGQSVERFSGGRGEVSARDHLFFFHTLLWAFLPWALLLYAAWFSRLRELWRGRAAAFRAREQLGVLGPIAFLALLGFSRFKLPHYVNVLLPVLSVTTAGWLVERWREDGERAARLVRAAQGLVVAVLVGATVALGGWFFPPERALVVVGAVALAALLAVSLRATAGLDRLWVPSALAALLLNFTLNASVYPQLSRLEAGRHVADAALRLGIDGSRTFFLGGKVHQPFQLYSGLLVPLVPLARVHAALAEPGARAWALADEAGFRELRASGLPFREHLRTLDCRVTRVTPKMLRRETREAACPQAYLVEIGPLPP